MLHACHFFLACCIYAIVLLPGEASRAEGGAWKKPAQTPSTVTAVVASDDPTYSLHPPRELTKTNYLVETILITIVFLLVLVLWNRSLRHRVALKTAEQEETLSYLNATLAALPDLLFEMDADGYYHHCYAARPELLVAPPEELLGRRVYDVMSAESADIVMDALDEAKRYGTSTGKRIRLTRPNWEHWFEFSIARKAVPSGQSERFIVISRDITERWHAEAEIQQLAFFDPLTQLPNRRMLEEQLKQTLFSCKRHRFYAALLFIDLDHFKQLNDRWGHRTGDELLLHITQRMKTCMRGEDCISRFGGDEFVMILKNLSHDVCHAQREAQSAVEKLLGAIRMPIELEEHTYSPSGSIGVYLFNGSLDETVSEAIKCADIAMYRAKTAGRNDFCFFDSHMQKRYEEQSQFDARLQQAILEQQFELHYHPIHSQDSGLIGAEAILRWRHPQYGLSCADHCLALAEESHLIISINRWMLETACDQLLNWRRKPQTQHWCLTLNLSIKYMQSTGFINELAHILQQYTIESRALMVEINEEYINDQAADLLNTLDTLKQMGVCLALDHFGTGQASLLSLYKLPLDAIKIDPSLVQQLNTPLGDKKMLRASIDIARRFEMLAIATGVETEAQGQRLFAYGCTHYQKTEDREQRSEAGIALTRDTF